MKKKPRQRAFGFANWGGKRRGAGRKPKGERAGVSHSKRPMLAKSYPVLVTLRLRAGLPTLRRHQAHDLLRSAFIAGSSEEFQVVEYSVQANHLHLLVESKNERALTRGMIGLGVRVSRGLNRIWRRVGSVFVDRYHARILSTPRAVRNALVYVIQNARKHGAWFGHAPDPFSSGPSFTGWKENPAQSVPRWLARARTWLLSFGWLRHGRLGLREAPAGGWPPT